MLEGDGGDGGGVLLGGVGGEAVEAALVAAADHVEDCPGGGFEALRVATVRREFVGGGCFGKDREEGTVADAEEFVRLAAVALLPAYGGQEAVQALLLFPKTNADGDGGGEAVAYTDGGAGALVRDLLEMLDGLLNGGGVNVLFGLEVEVERALGDLRGGGNVVYRGVCESFAAEDLDRGGEDFVAAEVGENLLAVWDGGHVFQASTGVREEGGGKREEWR
jgi:hypothetical protein